MRDIMTKHKTNKIHIIIGILFIVVGILVVKQLFLFSMPDREIGRSSNVIISGATQVNCPTIFDGKQVDTCMIVNIEGYRLPIYASFCPTSAGCNSGWYSASCSSAFSTPADCQNWLNQGTQASQGCSEYGSCAPSLGNFIGNIWITNYGYSYSSGGIIIYNENFIQCPDSSYNYRSSCPKPITCNDVNHTIVYDISKCPVNPPPLPPDNLWTSILNTLYSWLHDTFPAIFK